MPLYEYQCASCAHRLEIIQKFADGPPDTCPKCGKGPLERRLSSPAIQFKGTGWYVTDYASKGKRGGGDGESKEASSKSDSASSTSESGSSGESKKGDSKSDSKSDSSPSTASSTSSSTSSATPAKAPSKD